MCGFFSAASACSFSEDRGAGAEVPGEASGLPPPPVRRRSLFPQILIFGLSFAQFRAQGFNQVQQQADALPGPLVLDAGQIDLLENLLNSASHRLAATHPSQLTPTDEFCPEEIEQK
jgi:hypothetical protein